MLEHRLRKSKAPQQHAALGFAHRIRQARRKLQGTSHPRRTLGRGPPLGDGMKLVDCGQRATRPTRPERLIEDHHAVQEIAGCGEVDGGLRGRGYPVLAPADEIDASQTERVPADEPGGTASAPLRNAHIDAVRPCAKDVHSPERGCGTMREHSRRPHPISGLLHASAMLFDRREPVPLGRISETAGGDPHDRPLLKGTSYPPIVKRIARSIPTTDQVQGGIYGGLHTTSLPSMSGPRGRYLPNGKGSPDPLAVQSESPETFATGSCARGPSRGISASATLSASAPSICVTDAELCGGYVAERAAAPDGITGASAPEGDLKADQVAVVIGHHELLDADVFALVTEPAPLRLQRHEQRVSGSLLPRRRVSATLFSMCGIDLCRGCRKVSRMQGRGVGRGARSATS